VALVGGGAHPRPGEISLAHHGVLFLDELPEWSRAVLDVLREPLENGRILISRAARQCEFPARFQLVAAMNPCPCGYYGDPSGRCRCSPDLINRYQSRVSGPLMDRIDLRIEVPRPSHRELSGPPSGDDSATVRARVLAARARQQARAGVCNALLGGEALQRDCALADAERRLLEQAAERGWLSARAYHRVLRVARTLADLDGAERIGRTQLLEALSYRRVDLGGARAA
jgi:magnesium chelatase family protein